MTTITEHELAQCERANAQGRPAVVFIHGLWLLPSSWDRWMALFEEAGYTALAPGWPDDPETVAEANAHPEVMAGKSIGQVAEHFAAIVRGLKRKPAIVGHSFGGLLAQILAGQGLSAATVAIDPAPFRGVLPLPISALKSAWPVLGNPANRNRAVPLTFDQFRYGFANAVSEDEAKELYASFAVPAAGTPLFQAAVANFNPWTEAKVDSENPERGPLLILSGEKDHTVPWAIANASFQKQKKNGGVTEIVEMKDRGHALTIDNGWREVAETSLKFVRRFLATFAVATLAALAPPAKAEGGEPIWDANTTELIRVKLGEGAYAFYPKNAEELNRTGGAAATSGGLLVGKDGALLVETFLNRKLFDQAWKLAGEATPRKILYAVNTSFHGDHSYGNMYVPAGVKIVQHENTQAYVDSHLAEDKAFMIGNFGSGRGIEEIVARKGDVLVKKGATLTLDLGGRKVDLIDFGFAQTGGDLFVWDRQTKTLFAGNPVIAAQPALPWLLDGHLLETLATLEMVYAFLPPDAKIVPGHGVAIGREQLRWHIDYLKTVRDQVARAIADGLTLEETVARVKMPEFGGYVLFGWVHPSLNVPAAYKDLAGQRQQADLIVRHAAITTLDDAGQDATALAVKDGRIVAVGSDQEIASFQGERTIMVDAGGRRLIPGLDDSHAHYLRGGVFFNELRWDGLASLARGLELVKEQAAVTPPDQWVRVVGGFTPYQFAERRMPTPAELTAASPDRPVYIQYFYSVVVMNQKALAALKIDRNTPAPAGTRIEKDPQGNPTGNFYAAPSPHLFYGLLAGLPKPTEAEAENGVRQLFHVLARYGLTSVIDAGGGGFNFPDDYEAPIAMVKAGKLPLRVSYYLFSQHAGKELEDYRKWIAENEIGNDLDPDREHAFELEGGGEWVLWKAGDYESFRSPRPTPEAGMEAALEPVVRQFVRHRWPFRIHATYEESVARLLDVIEKVNADTPLAGLRWAIDHAETLAPATADRIRALGGGVAIQDRMYFLGDDFLERYGQEAAGHAPPARLLIEKGIPVGMGTDATRSSFNPWVALEFLVTGKVASGAQALSAENRLSREEALRLYTVGSAWFSQEEKEKGRLLPGQLADFAILSKDFMTLPENEISTIESLLTVVGGKPVYAAGEYAGLVNEKLPPALPAWSPVGRFPSYFGEL